MPPAELWHVRAAFLLLLFVLVGVIGARAYLVKSRTGRNPFIVLSERRLSLDLVAAVGLWTWLAIVLYYAARGPFGPKEARWWWLIAGPHYSAAHYSGLLLIVGACTVITLAIVHLGQAWRIGIDRERTEELVTRGIYGHVRHPIYLGLQLSACGVFLMAPNLFFALSAVLIVAGAWRQALREEAFLKERFGAAYEDYMSATGRFLPRVLRETT